METKRFQMPLPDQPVLVGRHEMRGIKAQALEDMRGDLGAFLRRGGGQRMQRAHTRRQFLEYAKLPFDALRPPILPRILRQRIGIDRLP